MLQKKINSNLIQFNKLLPSLNRLVNMKSVWSRSGGLTVVSTPLPHPAEYRDWIPQVEDVPVTVKKVSGDADNSPVQQKSQATVWANIRLTSNHRLIASGLRVWSGGRVTRSFVGLP